MVSGYHESRGQMEDDWVGWKAGSSPPPPPVNTVYTNTCYVKISIQHRLTIPYPNYEIAPVHQFGMAQLLQVRKLPMLPN